MVSSTKYSAKFSNKSGTRSVTKQTLQDRSRFVRQLTALSAQNLTAADYNLAERLGHFVGVSGSMNLARGLRSLPTQAKITGSTSAEALQTLLFEQRARMIRVIVESFSADTNEGQNAVPSTATGVRVEALKTFEPYQRFYTTHQIEMAVSVKNLRIQMREALSGVSTAMHQLAELDKTLDDSLEAHARKLFNVSPKLLEQRFRSLLQQHAKDAEIEGEAWLELFYQDMRELLLAELDVRLQPVLGLLEALNEHEGRPS